MCLKSSDEYSSNSVASVVYVYIYAFRPESIVVEFEIQFTRMLWNIIGKDVESTDLCPPAGRCHS